MNFALLILAGVIGMAVILYVRRRVAPAYSVTSRDIPEVLRQLEQSGKHGDFAVFLFTPPGSSARDTVNLQYSIENGVAGLDWILMSPRNVADQEKIGEFASKIGQRLEKREMNDVHYLRATGSGISELGGRIIREIYQIAADARIELITEGFEWKRVK